MAEPRYTTEKAAPTAKPATTMESMSNTLIDLNEAADKLLVRMRALLTRAHGPAPDEPASKLSSVPCGVIGCTTERLGQLARQLGEMDAAFEVIETII